MYRKSMKLMLLVVMLFVDIIKIAWWSTKNVACSVRQLEQSKQTNSLSYLKEQ